MPAIIEPGAGKPKPDHGTQRAGACASLGRPAMETLRCVRGAGRTALGSV